MAMDNAANAMTILFLRIFDLLKWCGRGKQALSGDINWIRADDLAYLITEKIRFKIVFWRLNPVLACCFWVQSKRAIRRYRMRRLANRSALAR